jgi:hypothetical protein
MTARKPPGRPAIAGRNPDGRFAKGNRINPNGKPLGARHRATQMVDALVFKNVQGMAQVLIREGLAGQGWAVKAALTGMLPSRSRRIDQPIDLPAPTSTEEATAQIAMLVSSIAKGEVDIDAAQVLIAGLQGYIGGCSVAEIERKSEEDRTEIARLKIELAEMLAKVRIGT